ncbi:hypothetical protein [Lacticaseibacillus sp. 53-4]|uniref:hypothetical protein n=1 Tax=Lacticaseibacillus sp. 53-4 TaxID=2799575 RepID=UPI001943EF14|nr:hypothetical protein [Lacticaseibacillus sp. 53-4]
MNFSQVMAVVAVIISVIGVVFNHRSNALLKKQVEEETDPKPKLIFDFIANEEPISGSGGHPDKNVKQGYKLRVMNYGKAPARLKVSNGQEADDANDPEIIGISPNGDESRRLKFRTIFNFILNL